MRFADLLTIAVVMSVISSCEDKGAQDQGQDSQSQSDTLTGEDLTRNDAPYSNDEAAQTDSDEWPDLPLLSAPEGLLVHQDQIIVANANGAWNEAEGKMTYGPGYLTIYREDPFVPRYIQPLPYLNPQFVTKAGDLIAITCSGTVTTDENWKMTPDTDGGIALLDADTLEEESPIPIGSGDPGPLAGFPGSTVYDSQTERMFVGSGTGPFVTVIDMNARNIVDTIELYDSQGSNDTIVLEIVEDKVMAASFNTGMMYMLFASTLEVDDQVIDLTATDQLEGPTDMIVVQDILYVLLSISSEVAAVNLDTMAVTHPFTVGAAPNRLASIGSYLFVVNSMDNNISRIDLEKAETVDSFVALDVGTNPWEMSIGDGYGVVTGYVANTLVKFALDDGSIQDVLSNKK